MTTERIRWERNDDGSSVTAAHEGYAGTISEPLFFIFEPDDRDPWWILTSSLPGLPGAGRAERRAHGADTDKLRAEAERWLAEFAGSLGAVFPDDEDEFSDEDDEWLEVTWAAWPPCPLRASRRWLSGRGRGSHEGTDSRRGLHDRVG